MAHSQTPVSAVYLNDPMSIYQWAQGKREEIKSAFNMKGGWEGWLQVELGLQLGSAYGRTIEERERNGYTVEREQHLFKHRDLKKENDKDPNLATDMVITLPNPKGGAPIRTIVELKCEGVKQDCRIDSRGQVVARMTADIPPKPYFARRIEVDMGKIGVEGQNIHRNYFGCDYLVIGFSLSAQAKAWIDAAGAGSGGGYFMAISPAHLDIAAVQMGLQRTQGVPSLARPDDTMVMWFYRGTKTRHWK